MRETGNVMDSSTVSGGRCMVCQLAECGARREEPTVVTRSL
jgi:hypothetical protein